MINTERNTYIINKEFDELYERTILKKYRNEKLNLKHDSIKNNPYAIKSRINLTDEIVYTIDPEGCIDADDGFSILKNYQDGKLFLAIHIADPTHYIIPNSEYFNKISERVVTNYPSKHENNHMLDEEVMNLSSLMETTKYGNIKNAITLITEIDTINKCLKKNTSQIEFTKISVKKENKLEYSKINLELLDDVKLGVEISKNLRRKRITSAKNMSSLEPCDIKYHSWGFTELKLQDKMEIDIHIMIEEFALYMNSFVGDVINLSLGRRGIYRECSDKGKLDENNNLTGNDLRDLIIKYGIVAKYTNKSNPHDLIGVKNYTHFTSPIRRFSDCISHYLVKYIYLKSKNINIQLPFSDNKLNEMIKKIDKMNSFQKIISFDDKKFRTIQALANMLSITDSIKLDVKFLEYGGLFVNIKIYNVNFNNIDYPIYISGCYHRKRWNYEIKSEWEQEPIRRINISKINLPGRFFEGTFPQIDILI